MTIDSKWYDFFEQVREARSQLGNPKSIWYRGQSCEEWKLVPGLHRWQGALQKEQDLFVDYHRTATRLQEKRQNDWEVLFDMQHYGLPTRLIDWTETLGIALAFAVLDHNPSYGNAALWVLDPVALNKMSGLRGIKGIPSDGFEYKNVYWQSQPFAAQYPIAIAPDLQNARMVAQTGTFTIHGENAKPLEEICPTTLRKVPLPLAALDCIREFLDYANLNSYTIYPDIVGMAKHIRRRHLGE